METGGKSMRVQYRDVRTHSASDQIDKPSSIAIAGCSYIYAPAGQAGEYAPLAANPFRGCGHACAYCYVPNVLNLNHFRPGSVKHKGGTQ
jgi:hypothetical protein